MARRRMIDPSVWTSENFSKLNYFERIFLIGLISNADDEGKGKAKPEYLRSVIFPYDEISVKKIVSSLRQITQKIDVVVYKIGENSYYYFKNWFDFQRIDHPQKSNIPNPVLDENGEIIPEMQYFEDKGKNNSKNKSKNDYENDSAKNLTQYNISLNLKEDNLKEDKAETVPVLSSEHNSSPCNNLSNVKEKKKNYIDVLLEKWVNAYQEIRGKPYYVTNKGRDTKAIAFILGIFKKEFPDLNTEQMAEELEKFFRAAITQRWNGKEEFFWYDKMTPSIMASKFNEIRNVLEKENERINEAARFMEVASSLGN